MGSHEHRPGTVVGQAGPVVRHPSLQLGCKWETLGPATTWRSLPHQTQKDSAGLETALQVPERSRRGSPLGRSSVTSGWQRLGACEVDGQGTAAWPPGSRGCSGLAEIRGAEAPGLPPSPGLAS